MKSRLYILFFAVFILLINILADRFYFRLDLTEDKQYTLSRATRTLLKNIDEPLTVKAYFSDELPPHINRVRKDFEEMLIEYNRLANDNIVYSFINPNESDDSEQDAMQSGIQPVMINVREKHQVKQQKAFLGAVLELGEKKEIIPFMEPGSALEYTLTTAIKKMTITEKPVVGLVQGNGEPPLDEMVQAQAGLSVLYQVEPYGLTGFENVPDRYSTLALVGTSDSMSAGQLAQLDAFLERGGNLFIAMNRVRGDLQNGRADLQNTGLENWLFQKGLIVDESLVTDIRCGSVTVQQQQGGYRYASNVNFHYFPLVSNFADHPITKGLEAIMFQFVSPLEFVGDTAYTSFTPLVFTSEQSGRQDVPMTFLIQKQWRKSDFPMKSQVLAGVLEKKTSGTKAGWKIVVVGNGNFPVNGPRGRQQQLQPDQVNLMVNGIDWLSDDTGLIELRTRGIAFRPIDELEDGTKTLLKYLNFLLPILLLVVYGLIRMQINRNKRFRRMQEDFS